MREVCPRYVDTSHFLDNVVSGMSSAGTTTVSHMINKSTVVNFRPQVIQSLSCPVFGFKFSLKMCRSVTFQLS